MSPYDSDDLTEIIEKDGSEFVVLWSPETAEHRPDYRELGRFATRTQAERFLGTQAIDLPRSAAIGASMLCVVGIDHLVLTVSDFARLKALYRKVLGFLGVKLKYDYADKAG